MLSTFGYFWEPGWALDSDPIIRRHGGELARINLTLSYGQRTYTQHDEQMKLRGTSAPLVLPDSFMLMLMLIPNSLNWMAL